MTWSVERRIFRVKDFFFRLTKIWDWWLPKVWMAVSSAEVLSSLEPILTVTSLVSGIFKSWSSTAFTTLSVTSRRVPGGKSSLIINCLWSTRGRNWRSVLKRITKLIMNMAVTRTITLFFLAKIISSQFLNLVVYSSVLSSTFFMIRWSLGESPNTLTKTGTRDIATRMEAISENEIVKESCLKTWPAMPTTKPKGRNTAILVSVEPIMGGIISVAPLVTAA